MPEASRTTVIRVEKRDFGHGRRAVHDPYVPRDRLQRVDRRIGDLRSAEHWSYPLASEAA